MNFLDGYLTIQGNYRKSNQDSIFLMKAAYGGEEILFAGVCDGMGGYEAGEVASSFCARQMNEWFRGSLPKLFHRTDNWEQEICREWAALIRSVNHELVRYGGQKGIQLGTTLTGFLIAGGEYLAVNVGDSRGYMFGKKIMQITKDQSLVAEKVRCGLITEEEAKISGERNVLLQSVGIDEEIKPEYYGGKVLPGVGFLICSDGFWHNVSGEEIISELTEQAAGEEGGLSLRLMALAEQAMERGEKDNISAVCVRVTDDAPRPAVRNDDYVIVQEVLAPAGDSHE